ncbi:AAA family ATPase [Bradyrhizobium sp. 197]|uniref:LuxR C-terminal-related transcriptional regulator n=1 Tax=Bradyrhizobium sp. 197 TaxID=2782663 RepID=UPI001FF77279|nr:AAA family ATPase [Bradyrhizobium sp. 197]MCK1479698.1 AAA family ATPase [Bradyrhizobium sp. 197]
MVQEQLVRVERRLSAILAADVAGYSRLMHSDEEATHSRLSTLLVEAVAPAISEHGGRIVKSAGDGFLADFPSAVEAVRAALQFQARIRELTMDDVADRRIAFRVGINIGDVIVEPNDIFGDSVNIAARLESIAEPGGICISSSAYDHVRDKVAVEFADLGEQTLKNIARPVRVYGLIRDGAGAGTHGISTTPSRPSTPGPVKRLLERERELAVIEELLGRRSGALAIEVGVGVGKTALVQAACRRAQELGYEVLSARGLELEADFAFGVVRQLFERRLIGAGVDERASLLVGPAAAVGPLLLGKSVEASAGDTSFAVLHGLYWLAANLSVARPLLLAIDDAHWADEPSLRWLSYLAQRLDGLTLVLLVALRPGDPAIANANLLALLAEAPTILRPALLSERAVGTLVRSAIGTRSNDGSCEAVWTASGGNPLYITELLRALALDDQHLTGPAELLVGGIEGIGRRVIARVRRVDPAALRLAQALAVLGDGCELRHAAATAGLEMSEGTRLATVLVRLEVLADDDPPRFIHPVVRDALETSLGGGGRDAAHRSAARLLHAERASAGQIAAHLALVRPAGDEWVIARLNEAAEQAIENGAPKAAADLLNRALREPPPTAQRAGLLRKTARAEVSAGRETALEHLEEALRSVANSRERAEIALEVAQAYAALFRWVDAVDAIERGLAELGDADQALAGRLEGELVVCGLHDARRASRVKPVLERYAAPSSAATHTEALAARGMAMVLAGRPAEEAAIPLESALAGAAAPGENWDTRAALLWSLVTAERFQSVETALEPMLAEVQRSGSARGFVAVYSTLALLKLRLGALPDADAAARVALQVLRESDFRPGLAFAVTILADVGVEAGELAEAESLLSLLPQQDWPAGVGTVLIPAARARLRLAQGLLTEALFDFQTCAAMFSPDVWGTEIRDVGYLHARAGAALALLRLGERERARELAEAELADVRMFGAPRALGVALRAAGLAHGGSKGIELLGESAASLRKSPAVLERAHSLAELGAALRRDGCRSAAREPLGEALDLAARCGARPLAARVREELKATGARPRREWRTGLEALSPRELRVAQLAAEGRTNREIAYQLYVTLKTIEGHLARAYTKLGIERRNQLSKFFAGTKTRVPTP